MYMSIGPVSKKCLTLFAIVCLALLVFFVSISRGSSNTEKRPIIHVQRVDCTPEYYISGGDTMHQGYPTWSSKIHEDYSLGKSAKWITKYAYVYKIIEDTRYFEREKYLASHLDDAIDKKLIFSNQPPSEKDFRIANNIAAERFDTWP